MNEQDILLKLNDHQHEISSLKYRVEDCEKQQTTLTKLAESVNKLAVNMDVMLKNMEKQDSRINKIEQTPLEEYKNYKKVIGSCIITGIIGTLIGAILTTILK